MATKKRTTKDKPEIITVAEAARVARLCERTIRSLCERGNVRAVKISRRWLINRAAFYELLGIED